MKYVCVCVCVCVYVGFRYFIFENSSLVKKLQGVFVEVGGIKGIETRRCRECGEI